MYKEEVNPKGIQDWQAIILRGSLSEVVGGGQVLALVTYSYIVSPFFGAVVDLPSDGKVFAIFRLCFSDFVHLVIYFLSLFFILFLFFFIFCLSRGWGPDTIYFLIDYNSLNDFSGDFSVVRTYDLSSFL